MDDEPIILTPEEEEVDLGQTVESAEKKIEDSNEILPLVLEIIDEPNAMAAVDQHLKLRDTASDSIKKIGGQGMHNSAQNIDEARKEAKKYIDEIKKNNPELYQNIKFRDGAQKAYISSANPLFDIKSLESDILQEMQQTSLESRTAKSTQETAPIKTAQQLAGEKYEVAKQQYDADMNDLILTKMKQYRPEAGKAFRVVAERIRDSVNPELQYKKEFANMDPRLLESDYLELKLLLRKHKIPELDLARHS